MLNCGACGLTNRPYEVSCELCHEPLQEVDAAHARRREWDALSPALRAEQEKAFDRMREGTLAHLKWLRSHRWTHAVIGALLLSLPMNGSTFFASPWSILIDSVMGAVAGLTLNRMHGGAWRGLGLFVGACVLSVLLRAPFLNSGLYLAGGWLMTCFAVLLTVVGAYFLGLKLMFDHNDRSMTP